MIELDLLLACARTTVTDATMYEIRSLAHTVNWEVLLKKAISHSVVPLLYNSLTKVCPDLVPDYVLNELRQYFNSNAFHSLTLTADLIKIVHYLEQNGVPVVALKGPALAMSAYGNLAFRSFQDLDIWVLSKDYFKPKILLSDLGYQSPNQLITSEKKKQQFFQNFGEYVLVHADSFTHIDVHRNCVGRDWLPLSANFERFWQRIELNALPNQKISSLCSEDLLLYLCVNGTKDCWQLLRSICDVAELINNQPRIDWNALIQEAKELSIERILKSGLLISYRLLAAKIPISVIEYALSDSSAEWLTNRVCKRIRGEIPDLEDSSIFEKFVFRLIAIEHWADQLRYCLKVPSRTFKLFFTLNYRDQAFLPLPQHLYFMYYFIRPIRLLKDHGLRVFRLALP